MHKMMAERAYSRNFHDTCDDDGIMNSFPLLPINKFEVILVFIIKA